MSLAAIESIFAEGRVRPPVNGETEEEIFQSLKEAAEWARWAAGLPESNPIDDEIGRSVARRIYALRETTWSTGTPGASLEGGA